MAGRVCFAALVAAGVILASATPERAPEARRRLPARPGHKHTLHAAPGDLNYAFGPKRHQRAWPGAHSIAADGGATLTVTYDGFDASSRAAFQAAVDIWASTIESPVPIRIRATWTSMGPDILGSAWPTVLCGADNGVADTYYAAALADKLDGGAFCAALVGENAEIEAYFNSDFDDWDFGTSGVGVPDKYSFMTAVLHEIGHGLGFVGLFTSSNGMGDLLLEPNTPSIYDRFAVDGDDAPLLGLARPSAALHGRLTGDDTFFNGANATFRNAGSKPKLETHDFEATWDIPSDHGWLEGSSYSHVDDVSYSATPNGLMTWALNSNEVFTDVGPIVKGIFQDQGWTIRDVPSMPLLIAPSGTIATTTPNFSWTAVADATSYDVYIAAGASPVVNTTYAASAHCSGGTCTLPSPIALTNGQAYAWRVRGRNANGGGVWSATSTITVAVLPAATSVIAPVGSGAALQSTYVWNAVSDATYYLLQVSRNGTVMFQQWYTTALAACTVSRCSVTPATVLSPLTPHSVRVQTWNPGGYGPWSASVPFTTGQLPAAPSLSGPGGTVTTPAPTYSWSVSAGATAYYLWVTRVGSGPTIQTVYPASSVCTAAVCSVTPRTELLNGEHRWWIQAISAVGAGPWSAAGTFAVNATAPSLATLTWPVSRVSGAIRPTYRWNRVSNSTWYYLWVDRGPATTPTLTTWFFGADVCSGTVCSVTPNVPLTPGTSYRWYIQTWSSRGTGPWAGTTLSVAARTPGLATLVAPGGSGVVAKPTYVWLRVEGSSWYYLWVSVGGQPVTQIWYRAEDVCVPTGPLCSMTSNLPLSSGSYVFWIQTWNDFGYGPWSAARAFSR
jgi:hypothetical protein